MGMSCSPNKEAYCVRMSLPPYIWDDFHASKVPPETMDALLAQGWRHFGTHFYRYSLMAHEGEYQTVVPLRINLSKFTLSKSQRRVLRKNADVTCMFLPASISNEAQAMFQRHKRRFTDNIPEDLSVFLSSEPASVPGVCLTLRCTVADECVALSFIDVGDLSTSSVYGMFEPEHEARSLGIFTMLCEIEWAQQNGKVYAYPGYATLGSSHYDYKKQFSGLEGYHWASQEWIPWPEFPH